MSYTGTKSQTGLGTNLSINTGTVTTPVWTQITEITSSKQSGRVAQTADVTNLQSGAAEFITTIVESGMWDITGNRVSGDVGQVALETAFSALAMTLFKVTLPKSSTQTTTGDVYQFSAVVSEYDPAADVSPKNAIQFNAKLKVSNTITYTVGS